MKEITEVKEAYWHQVLSAGYKRRDVIFDMKEAETKKIQRMLKAGINTESIIAEMIAERNKLKGTTFHLGIDGVPGYFDSQFFEEATKDRIRHWADAAGDSNPLWRSEDYARNTIHGGIIAPPTFLTCIAYSTRGFGLPMPGILNFSAGAKWERFHEVRVGDIFRVLQTNGGIEVKRKSPPLWIQHTYRTYINQKDQIVAIIDCRLLETISLHKEDNKEKPLSEKPGFNARCKYTEAELEAIHRAHAEEERRGANTLYWEDVVAGEKIKPVVKHAVDIWDQLAILGTCGMKPYHQVYEMYKHNPTYFVKDPETNVPHFDINCHFDDRRAQISGNPGATSLGWSLELWIAHLITNWIGDDGFLTVQDNSMRKVFLQGDTVFVKGEVIRKYVEDGDHLAEVSAHVEDHRGTNNTYLRASCTVRLPSRTEPDAISKDFYNYGQEAWK